MSEAAVPALVADIGGTNARFALAWPAADGAPPRLEQPQSLRTADFPGLQQAAEHYLAAVGARPRRAAFAVASAVAGADEVRLTNCAWSFSQAGLRAALGLDALAVLNDFGALARAVPVLAAEHLVELHGPAAGAAGLAGPVSVLGPGTGLGVALLVGSTAAGWQVVETEGGHVGFAPQGEEEARLARWIAARFGRCSNERLLSGEGLSFIHAALGADTAGAPAADWRSQLRGPADIVAAALDGHDPDARRTLARFCAVLGSVAGDLALAHGARTVMIAGGIVPRFLPFLRDSAFRARFLDKGRFSDWLAPVRIAVVVHPQPGLLGAALALD